MAQLHSDEIRLDEFVHNFHLQQRVVAVVEVN
jgi:hypothetical protein